MSKCKYCGEEFKPKQGVEKFCSRECWGKSRRVKDVKINCPTCGDEFEIKPYLIKEGVKRFCSKKCYTKYRTKHKYEERICEYCGETYKVYSSRKNRYCSTDCANKHRYNVKIEREFDELLQNM
jgi:hypothetical protein|nr:MAG TPA_asm: cysteine-rich protein [Caudoviricetes sp.]